MVIVLVEEVTKPAATSATAVIALMPNIRVSTIKVNMIFLMLYTH